MDLHNITNWNRGYIQIGTGDIFNNRPGMMNVGGSGMRIYYTDSERDSEIGTFRLQRGEFVIPPRQSTYEVSFGMHAECTNNFLPSDGVEIVYIGT